VFSQRTLGSSDTGKAAHNGASPHLDDDTLIAKALNARNGGKFSRLWSGDIRGYPSHSEADLALCGILAFYIGDEAQLDRLFRRSALYRDKWDEVHGDATYGQRTMHTVLNQDRDRWTPRQASRNSQSADTDHEASDGARQARHQTLPLSDQTNAEALVRTHGKDLRYSHPAKQWYVWDGRRWRADETAAIMRFAKSTIKAMAACIPEMDDDQAKASLAHIKTSLSAPRLKSMVELATSEPGIPVLPHELDQDPWLSNCLNGTLNLKTRELQPHRREDLITKLAPVAYDPKARSARWDDFLTRVLPDESVRGYVQRAAGYSLTGLGTEEVLFFPFGPTKTGKSTLLKALRATMGEYATTADFETFLARDHITGSPRQDIADLAGKRLVVSLEVDQGKRLAEGLIKWLFGGDYVKARFLYQREFEFLPTFKLWLAANHRPQVSPDDDAIWERIRQIAFDQHIPKAERDPGVKAELSDPEQSGAAILAWAVQGCFDWQQQGLDDPVKVTAATEDYRKEMNPLPDFLEACTIPKDRGRILNADLWSRYQAWARKNPDRPRLGRKTFTQQLEARGLDSLESGGHRFWLGIELRYTTGEAEEKE
jgi:putative DNA primase/helicase